MTPLQELKQNLTSQKQALLLLGIAACCLVVLEYQGNAFLAPWSSLLKYFGWYEAFNHWLYYHEEAGLHQKLWWVAWTGICYLVIPLLSCAVLGLSPLSLGLRWPGLKALVPYLLLYVLVLPLVFWAAHQPGFQATYPFFTSPLGLNSSDGIRQQISWELAYAFQFFALEFFFRGFITLGLKPSFGMASIFVMVLPYVMIHFSKPQPEAFGSLFAGLILGYMSWKSNSIWGGVLLHVAVAWTMDGLAV